MHRILLECLRSSCSPVACLKKVAGSLLGLHTRGLHTTSYGNSWCAFSRQFVAFAHLASPGDKLVNPYQVLGVSENASSEEIKAAYESRAKRYSPESGGDAWALHQVQQAYDALSPVQANRVRAETPLATQRPRDKKVPTFFGLGVRGKEKLPLALQSQGYFLS